VVAGRREVGDLEPRVEPRAVGVPGREPPDPQLLATIARPSQLVASVLDLAAFDHDIDQQCTISCRRGVHHPAHLEPVGAARPPLGEAGARVLEPAEAVPGRVDGVGAGAEGRRGERGGVEGPFPPRSGGVHPDRVVPDLDAGNQIIYQSTFTVPHGMPLDDVIRLGQEDNEPHCLTEGVRRVVDREVQLHFHRVVSRRKVDKTP
jgi:hypothetical protein